MTRKFSGMFAAALAASCCSFGGSALAAPAQRNAAETGPASQYVQKRQALQGTHADAQAILNALQNDPALGERLAANPASAQEVLRERGATRAEKIVVTPGGDGAARTITITITIDHVTIEIIIKL